MPPWKGSINELLTPEQVQRIEETLAEAPAGLCIDKRGMRLNRYPGLLANQHSEDEPFKVIASERPVTETGLVLVSNTPIPEIQRAVLVIRTDDDFRQQFEGRVLPSRPGTREEDRLKERSFHYSVFETDATPRP